MSQRKRHAGLTCGFAFKLDKLGMLRRLASLKSSSPRRPAIARAMFIAGLAIALSVAAPEKINTATADDEKPAFKIMNLKLYLHNQINDWDQFECANELGIRESGWRIDAVNKDSGAYGVFQHMSKYAPNWDAYTQIDKHIEYIKSRYDNDWCKALNHLRTKGWH